MMSPDEVQGIMEGEELLVRHQLVLLRGARSHEGQGSLPCEGLLGIVCVHLFRSCVLFRE